MDGELLSIARKTIEGKLLGKDYIVEEKIQKKFSKKGASFVTLTLDGRLRGCIGSLQARQELWKDVQENALNAAFSDFRFRPLKKEELSKIKIEVSVLSSPKKLVFSNHSDLLEKLNHNMGVIIQFGMHSATYLPQVWEQIPDKEEFLSSLCEKAGLDSRCWKNEKIEVSVYTVKIVHE
jgi:AmmeMemoRadiSam system protein A